MDTPYQPVYKILLEARRQKGITQTQLAKLAECKQSAICMMEKGSATALSHDAIVKIAKILEVELPETTSEEKIISVPPARSGNSFCPNSDCPSNVPYMVGEQVVLWPQLQPTANGKYCAYCGEVLETSCGNCDAPVTQGAFCPKCGAARVLPPEEMLPSPAEWVAEKRKAAAELKSLI